MATIDRVVYTNSGVTVTGATTGADVIETAQNATMTINVPRENVNTLGAAGTVDRPQLDAADASIEWTMIPDTSGSAKAAAFGAAQLQAYITNCLAQDPTTDAAVVAAKGIGQIEAALMNSFSCEVTVGAMANMTVSFTGSPTTTIPKTTAAGTPTTITLVQSKDVSVSATTGKGEFGVACAQSAATAWDVPVVNVICLGKNPATSSDVHPFGNPPGTASHTLEGLDVALDYTATTADYELSIGSFAFKLAGGFVDSQTNSVAVGDVFATFNYVIGGTGDSYTVS